AHGVDKGGEGNARAAIEALRIAGLLAESEGSGVVTLEHARRGIAETDPSIVYIKDVLLSLSLHELLIYKAIIEVLEQTGARWARMGEVEEAYEMLCEVYGERPRAHTQVYEYIRNLKRLNLIDTKISGKGYRGKTTLISVNAPLSELKKEVSELIEKMMSWGKVR
ncbi:MAG TPA: cell division control protein Cdc6, partial [Desulfurococcales archaeon]|nr:cell division control protein Cdc6 [Desulfurococcales archaeon]